MTRLVQKAIRVAEQIRKEAIALILKRDTLCVGAPALEAYVPLICSWFLWWATKLCGAAAKVIESFARFLHLVATAALEGWKSFGD